jgi:hypothetical protein
LARRAQDVPLGEQPQAGPEGVNTFFGSFLLYLLIGFNTEVLSWQDHRRFQEAMDNLVPNSNLSNAMSYT